LQVANSHAGQWIFQNLPQRSKALGLPLVWVNKAQEQGLIEGRQRKGSEKIQIQANSPRKTLKNLFQESDVPPWERQVPLLYINDELIAVAGVGVSYPHLVSSGKRVIPKWSGKQ
jgi:tRNA(Ile)-lysidine synthase